MTNRTALGIPLEPDERVLFSCSLNYTFPRALLIVLGIVSFVLVIGIFLIAWGVLLPRFSPHGVLITNKRIIRLGTKNESIAVADLAEVKPGRHHYGITTVGLAVGIADAIEASGAPLADPRRWLGVKAVTVSDRAGQSFTLPIASDNSMLGPMLACIQHDPASASKFPTVDAPA